MVDAGDERIIGFEELHSAKVLLHLENIEGVWMHIEKTVLYYFGRKLGTRKRASICFNGCVFIRTLIRQQIFIDTYHVILFPPP